MPGATAVVGPGRVVRRAGGGGEVTAEQHAATGVTEGHREDAGGRAAGDGGVGDGPRVAVVARGEQARRVDAAARKVGAAADAGAQAGAGGGEAELTGLRRRHARGVDERPRASAVARLDEAEPPVDGVAHGQATARRAEGHAVVEGGRVGVAEGLGPARAAVVGREDPRVGPLADRQHDGVAGVEGLDVAELQGVGAEPGRADVAPGGPAVARTQHGAVRATDPRDVPRHRSKTAEALGRAGRRRGPRPAGRTRRVGAVLPCGVRGGAGGVGRRGPAGGGGHGGPREEGGRGESREDESRRLGHTRRT